MKTIGIIAEFNPFHNGHEYLIRQAKKQTKADNAIIICSGNFVQRGAPAIFDKSIRAEMALKNGADVVFELPVFYSTSSAEQFAASAVTFLDKLGCIDYLCFGCESENADILSSIAEILLDEPIQYKNYLNAFLKDGISYAKAGSMALENYCESSQISPGETIHKIMSQPNNILAIEYLKSLKSINSSITPVAIKRKGEGYHSTSTDSSYTSATAIRNEIIKGHSTNKFIPDNCTNILNEAACITLSDFNEILGYALNTQDNFDDHLGVTIELSNRINKYKKEYTDIETFIKRLQSKNYIYSGISRALINIVLGIKKDDVNEFIQNNYIPYARCLGFKRDSQIMSVIKEKSTLHLIGKLSNYYSQSSGPEKKMLDTCINADNIYRMVYMTKYNQPIPNEFERQIIIK